MRFHGLLELDERIKEIDEEIGLKNEYLTDNGISDDEILKELGNCKEIEASIICGIIKERYKDRKEIDAEVRKAIRRLSVINYETLDKIDNYRIIDKNMYNRILDDMMNFDNGFMLEDYKNILRKEEIFVSDEMQEEVVILFSISLHVDSFIKSEEEKKFARDKMSLEESNNIFRF